MQNRNKMKNHSEISSFIWNVCNDVLRGLFKQHEYGDVILPFVVLRRLDCVIEPHKDEVVKIYNDLIKDGVEDPSLIIKKQTHLDFYNRSQFDLQRLKGDPNNIKSNFPVYLNGFSQNLFEIIENFQLEKPVEKLIKNNKLFLLVDKFTEIDLHPDVIDNHTMGQIFEELLRKFSEMSNETSGEHYTPRDVVKLLVSLVFSGEEKNLQDNSGGINVRTIFDPCCGTGGMLTIGKEWIQENVSKDVKINLFGQELNPQTYSICKSDFLITGENPDNIKGGVSSLSDDLFENSKYHYMITNPPFGVSWKSEQDDIVNESLNPNGRFSNGLPWIKDGQILFMSHLISKMKPDGSKIGVISNSSPLTTGDGSRGESQFRKWLIEEDLLESIILLPDDLFFNTGILSYIWIFNNNKSKERIGKIQIVNGLNHYENMYKSIGDKRKKISENHIKYLSEIYSNSIENEDSIIFNSTDFLYHYLHINHPLRDENGCVILDKKGNPKKDSSKTDKIKLENSKSIEQYEKELLNNFPDSWIDKDKTVVGCEFHITKYFFKPKNIKPFSENLSTINFQTKKINTFLNELDYVENKSKNKDYWFGKCPNNWEIKTIDNCFIKRNTKVTDSDFEPLSVTMSGVIPQLDSVVKTSDGGNRKLVKKNDFVINSRSDRRGSSGVSNQDGSVSNIYHVLEIKEFLLPKYVHHLFRSLEFQEEFYRNGKGIVDDLWTTDYNEMRKIIIPIPPLEIQKLIISKTEKTNNLVESLKNKILELELELKLELELELELLKSDLKHDISSEYLNRY